MQVKTAREWTDEFCNSYIINAREMVFEDFVRRVQEDALEKKDDMFEPERPSGTIEVKLEYAGRDTPSVVEEA